MKSQDDNSGSAVSLVFLYRLPLKDSFMPFNHGFPGWMKAVSMFSARFPALDPPRKLPRLGHR